MAKRLKRNRKGSIVLPSGETITVREQKAYQSAVVKANRARAKLIAELPEQAQQKYVDFKQRNEFHIRKKSRGYGQFESKKDFKIYMRSLEHISSGEFEQLALDTKYSNYIRALYNTYNSEANDIIEYVGGLEPKILKKIIDSEELEDITYIYYEPKGKADKLKHLKAQVEALKAEEERKK